MMKRTGLSLRVKLRVVLAMALAALLLPVGGVQAATLDSTTTGTAEPQVNWNSGTAQVSWNSGIYQVNWNSSTNQVNWNSGTGK